MPIDFDALLRTILQHPAEDWPRLRYADALMEQSAEGHARGEFIQVQVELARVVQRLDTYPARADKNGQWGIDLRDRKLKALYDQQDALRRRERELWNDHRFEWARPVSDLFKGPVPVHDTPDHPAVPWKYRRGFVESITCGWPTWGGGECPRCGWRGGRGQWSGETNPPQLCDDCSRVGHPPNGHAAAILAAQPVRRVRLTSEPRVTLSGDEDGNTVYRLGSHETIVAPGGSQPEHRCAIADLLAAHAVSLGAAPGIVFELPAAMVGHGTAPARLRVGHSA